MPGADRSLLILSARASIISKNWQKKSHIKCGFLKSVSGEGLVPAALRLREFLVDLTRNIAKCGGVIANRYTNLRAATANKGR